MYVCVYVCVCVCNSPTLYTVWQEFVAANRRGTWPEELVSENLVVTRRPNPQPAAISGPMCMNPNQGRNVGLEAAGQQSCTYEEINDTMTSSISAIVFVEDI